MGFLKLPTYLTMVLFALLFFSGQNQEVFADFDCNAVSEIPTLECEALVSLYNNTGGDSWLDNSGWLMTDTPCSWMGISCYGGHVYAIFLGENLLTGSIPPEIGNLSNLTVLYLRSNQLAGIIPPELGNLSNLAGLDLCINRLTGSIPPELGNLSNLTHFFLDSNQLTGNIP